MPYRHFKTLSNCLLLCLFSVTTSIIATGCNSTSADSTTAKDTATVSDNEPTKDAATRATRPSTARLNQIESELEDAETLIRDHAFTVNLSRLGAVDFVPVAVRDDRDSLALRLRDKNGRYTSLFLSDMWSFYGLDAVAFEDINGDGLGPDVVAIAQYITGVGPTGGQPFPYPTVLLNDGKDGFSTDVTIENLLSENDAVTIAEVRTILSNAPANLNQESVSHCFRNEYSNGDIRDVEELIINIAGSQATGEYNWIPAFKDRRYGTFDGFFANNTVDATYTFQQEGVEDSTQISILIEENKAIVEGGAPALGLDATLTRSDCS